MFIFCICCSKKRRTRVDNFPPPGLWHRATSPRTCLCIPPDSSCSDWLIEMVTGYIFCRGEYWSEIQLVLIVLISSYVPMKKIFDPILNCFLRLLCDFRLACLCASPTLENCESRNSSTSGPHSSSSAALLDIPKTEIWKPTNSIVRGNGAIAAKGRPYGPWNVIYR